MSKPMEQASFPVNITGTSNPGSQGSQQASKSSPSNHDDLSMKHVGVAVGVFAIMVGLFGYGFYVQQQRVTAKEPEVKIAEMPTVLKPDAPIMLSEASAQVAVPPTSAAVPVKEEPIAAPGRSRRCGSRRPGPMYVCIRGGQLPGRATAERRCVRGSIASPAPTTVMSTSTTTIERARSRTQ